MHGTIGPQKRGRRQENFVFFTRKLVDLSFPFDRYRRKREEVDDVRVQRAGASVQGLRILFSYTSTIGGL